MHEICTLIQARKNQHTSLTAAIRVFIMLYFRAATTDDGHKRAGHGNFEFMKAHARIPREFLGYFKPRKTDHESVSDGMMLSHEQWNNNGSGLPQQGVA